MLLSGLYRLESGEEIGLSAELYGSDFDEGRLLRLSGPVLVSFAYNQVTQPLRDAVEEGKDIIQQAVIGKQVNADMEEVFLRTCGILGPGPVVDHAAMYREHGWLAGPYCSMVWHRDPHAYVDDLEHFRRSFRRPLYVPQLIGLAPAPATDPDVDIFPRPEDPPDPHEALHTLLVDQGGTIMTQLRALPRDELLALLMRIGDDLYQDVVYYEHHGGLAVAEVPPGDLWQFYDRLARAALR